MKIVQIISGIRRIEKYPVRILWPEVLLSGLAPGFYSSFEILTHDKLFNCKYKVPKKQEIAHLFSFSARYVNMDNYK